MNFISLGAWDLALAAGLVVGLALISMRMSLGVGSSMLLAAARTCIQLLLVGLVLKSLFEHTQPWFMALVATVMLAAAAYEVMARQTHRLRGLRSYGLGALSMFVSSFAVTIISLTAIIGADPWYTPQYAIPLLGMMLGNSMTGIALSMERLNQGLVNQARVVEARLMLGETWCGATQSLRREAMRTAMIPAINAMAAAGLVSLPGMMTGQILAGGPPLEAVKYQIMIMYLVTAGAGFGALIAVSLGARALFDERHRLRLERLREVKGRSR